MSPGPIAYLSSVYPRATDTFVRGEIEALRDAGFQVETFSVRRPGPEQLTDGEVRAEAERTSVLIAAWRPLLVALGESLARSPLRCLSTLRLALGSKAPGVGATLRAFAYWLEALVLAKELRARGVTHLHNHITGNSAQVAMLASHLTGIPWSTTVHGMELLDTDALTLGTKLERAQFAVCISHYTRSQCMLRTTPKTWPKLHVIRCGLSAELLEAKATPLPPERRFVCVGRLGSEKGQLLLLEAMSALVKEGQDAQLVLVGDGPLRSELERRIAALDLNQRVRITGWADREVVSAHIESARALVIPSFSEGLPVVAMEALALGRPVIATRVGGVPELVESGATGWLVNPGSTHSLLAALREACESDDAELEALAACGAARVRERHDARVEALALARLLPGASTAGSPATNA